MMKEILTEALKTVEKAYENPHSVDLDKIIQQLQEAKERYGDKGTMLENTITALIQDINEGYGDKRRMLVSKIAAFIQMNNAIVHINFTIDYSCTLDFGEANNVLE